MRGPRYDRMLVGTALALVMALPVGAASAQTRPRAPVPPTARTLAAIDVTVPLPVETTLPPPTVADIDAQPGNGGKIQNAPENTDTGTTPTSDTPKSTGTPAPQVDPFASLDADVRPIAEKMRDLLTARSDRIFSGRKEQSVVESFYKARNYVPLWLDHGVEGERAKAAIERVKSSSDDGLNPNDYKVPDFNGTSLDALAEAELKLTAVVITFTRHLQAGRFPIARIGHDIEMPQQPPDVADVLGKLADGADIAAALDSYSPPHEGYQKLKAMLADMRGKNGAGSAHVADGPVLKVNKVPMEDERVPQLRTRLGIEGDPADLRYDAKLGEAVKKFQKANGLTVSGVLDSRTVKELNGPPRDRQIDVVLANMERWRWLPRDLGAVHVEVNIPEYQLRVFKDGAQIWNTRIVTGKPTLQTPLLTAEMKYITVNPTWNVPPSIIQNEYLPALQQDPQALERIGLKVTYNRDGTIHVSQPPGERNALGRVRFNFPNRFLVYQHDTPDKHLFAQETRAFSHGCMRVQDPPKYAEVLLGLANPNENWTAEKIRKMYGNAEQDIHFKNNIPVHLTYQTATVENGQLIVRRDVYGYDAKVIAAIKSERGMIEMAQERPKNDGPKITRPRLQPPTQQQQPVSFFEALFGGPTPAPTPQRSVVQKKRVR